MTRAVLYARLSKDVARTGAGVDRQMEDARKLADLRGFEVVAEHIDNDTSAAGGKRRPGFEAMLDHISDGSADTIVAWSWDRLSRNRRDTLRLMELGQTHRVTIGLVRGSDIDMSSASGRLVADVLAGVARSEIDMKSERAERAGLQAAQAGRPPARRAFGYQQDGTPDPLEAPAVVRMFSLFLAGSTMTGLAKQLNDEGLTSTRGKRFDDTTVRVVLTNPRYVGERWYRGVRVGVGNWPALISPETFAAVQAVLADPARKKRRAARRYLGSSLFFCHCGARVKVSYDGAGVRIYRCAVSRHMSRRADPVDDLVLKVVAARLRRQDIADIMPRDRNQADVAALRRQVLAVNERIEDLGVDYAEHRLTARQVQVATERLESTMTELQTKLADAGRGSALAGIMSAPDLGAAWLALGELGSDEKPISLDRQRAVLADVTDVVILPGRVGRVKFDPETVRFDWVKDTESTNDTRPNNETSIDLRV